MEEKKKWYQTTWFLWVCGILIPIVGIILLWTVHKEKSKGFKIGLSVAFGLWFLIALAINGSGSSTEQETPVAETEVSEPVKEATVEEVATEATTEATVEEVKSEPTEFEVKIDTTAKWDGNSVKFAVETNLPDETVLMLSLRAGDYNTDSNFTAQTKVTIKDGKAESEGFSNKGEKLTGDYDLSVSMSIPSTQAEAVRAVIGEKGEYMTGNLVEKASVGDSNVVSALYAVSLGDEITITPEDDYSSTTFREEGDDSAEATSTESTLTDEEQIKMLVAASEIILKQNFGDDYNISYDAAAKMVTINVWKDGIAAGAMGVQAGTVSKSDWTTMVNGVQSMAKSVYGNFEPYGVSVNVNVLNDINKDNTLLSFLNGVKFYDAVDG